MTRRHTFHIFEAYISTELLLAEKQDEPIHLLVCLYEQLRKDTVVCVELEFALRGNTQPLLDRLIPLMSSWDSFHVLEVYDALLQDKKWRSLLESYLDYLTKQALQCKRSSS